MDRIDLFIRSTLKNTIPLLLVAAAILLPRGSALGRYVVVDEVDWLQASANFYQALKSGQLGNTYQLEHPAVTTMWAGALGFMRIFSGRLEYKFGYVDSINQLHTYLLKEGTSPLAVLVSARMFVVLLITAGLLCAYFLLWRLVGRWPATVAILLVALDPFYIGLSRLLHMDGLLATFFLVCVLAAAVYLFERRKTVYLLLAGAAAGLAGLTKSPAIFLLPYIGLLLLLGAWWDRCDNEKARLDWGAMLKAVIIFGLTALLVLVLFWPAMWVAPVATFNKIIQGALYYAEQGHYSRLFFNGMVGNGADFPITFYPLTFLWRTTPIVVLGLVVFLLTVVFNWGMMGQKKVRQLALFLLLLALGFMLFMHMGAKKFDRYAVPAFLPLDILAGFGWFSLAQRLSGRGEKRHHIQNMASLIVILFLQLAAAVSVFPYYLSFYNPIMGGGGKAPDVMMIGWGEGLDQAARYLNDIQSGGFSMVTSGYGIGPLSFYYNRQLLYQPNVLNMENEWGPQNAEKLGQSEYVVLYVNQWQRAYVQPLLDALDIIEPLHIVTINGIEYARLYRVADLPQQVYQELMFDE